MPGTIGPPDVIPCGGMGLRFRRLGFAERLGLGGDFAVCKTVDKFGTLFYGPPG